jgi:Phytanoyl-CoA dioxygenase (PhyH)
MVRRITADRPANRHITCLDLHPNWRKIVACEALFTTADSRTVQTYTSLMTDGIFETDNHDFAQDGFAVLRSFLGKDELPTVRSLVNSFLATPLPITCARPHNTLMPLRWKDRLVQLLLTCGHRITQLSEVVYARDLRWISGYLSSKDAHSPPLWWHQDWWCWDHEVSYRRAATQVAVLCYLEDMSEQVGALRVLPGSHLKSTPLHHILPEAHSKTAEELEAGHPAFGDAAGQITLRLNSGDAVALDYRLFHGTHANATDRRRDCILLSFTPSWRHLPAEIRAHLIQHPAQPSREELPEATALADVLPSYDGTRGSLSLKRDAPAQFQIAGSDSC